MRPLAVVVAFALAAPAAYAQQPAARPRPAPAPRGGASAVAPRPAPAPIPPGIARPPAGGFPRPAPPGAYPHRYPYAPYYPYGHHYSYGYYPYGAFAPFWWGFDWGWGYYPYYPPYYPPYPVAGVYPPPGVYPVYPVPASPGPPPDAYRISTRLEVRGGWHSSGGGGGGVGGLAFAIDGRRFGFQTSIDAVSVKAVTGSSSLDFSSALGWGTMHGTWSVVSEDAFRVRLEVGGSMLTMPTSGSLATARYAGDVAFGPNFGASGTARLIGPLGVEAHARLTPVPVAVTDTGAALALRAGPLAVSGGWRWIDVAGNNTDAPQLHFSGPQIGLSFLF